MSLAVVIRKELVENGLGKRPSGIFLWNAAMALVFAVGGTIGAGLLFAGMIHDGIPIEYPVALAGLVGAAGAAFAASLIPMGLGPDMVAGERERHTLETLMAGPLPESQIIYGKILAMAILSMVAALAGGLAVLITLPILFGLQGLLWGLLAVPAAVVLTAWPSFFMGMLAAFFSAKAKTVKQAGQAMAFATMPVFLLPALLGPSFIQSPAIAIAVGGGILLIVALAQALLPVLLLRRFRRRVIFA